MQGKRHKHRFCCCCDVTEPAYLGTQAPSPKCPSWHSSSPAPRRRQDRRAGGRGRKDVKSTLAPAGLQRRWREGVAVALRTCWGLPIEARHTQKNLSVISQRTKHQEGHGVRREQEASGGVQPVEGLRRAGLRSLARSHRALAGLGGDSAGCASWLGVSRPCICPVSCYSLWQRRSEDEGRQCMWDSSMSAATRSICSRQRQPLLLLPLLVNLPFLAPAAPPLRNERSKFLCRADVC